MYVHSPDFSSFGHVVDEIKDLAQFFSRCDFLFSRRHCNAVAHRVARHVVTTGVPFCSVLSVPSWLVSSIQRDFPPEV